MCHPVVYTSSRRQGRHVTIEKVHELERGNWPLGSWERIIEGGHVIGEGGGGGGGTNLDAELICRDRKRGTAE